MGIFYRDEQVFGLDIGQRSLKLVDITADEKSPMVEAYGLTEFDQAAIVDGEIVDKQMLVQAFNLLVGQGLVGRVAPKQRVALCVPNSNSFSRIITLPKMSGEDLSDEIEDEIERSVPIPIDDLSYDWQVIEELPDGQQILQVVACPKKIIDSYIEVFNSVGVEIATIESNVNSMARIINHSEDTSVPTLMIDIGSTSCDLCIFDNKTIKITSTVACSSEQITQDIAKEINVSEEQARNIKFKFGLDKSQKQKSIIKASDKELSKLITEIKKMVRYFSDREENKASGKKIEQIIIIGGGANLPGLAGYLTDKTRIPTRLCTPWTNIGFANLQPPHELESTVFTTAAGLALISKQELQG